MLAYDYPLMGVFLTIAIFALWMNWLIAAALTFIDNFRRTDHSGWSKGLWALFIIIFPLVGVVVYIVRRPTTLDGATVPSFGRGRLIATSSVAGSFASPRSSA